MAANDDVFDPDEPKDADVREYAAALAEMVISNEEVYAALTKKLKERLGFFGDGSLWSEEKVERFDGMMTMALLALAKSHLRHHYAVEHVTPEQLTDHGCEAIEAVMRYVQQESAPGRKN